MASAEEREKKGIDAIISLQRIVGIPETKGSARRGWRAMSEQDRDTTLTAYDILKSVHHAHKDSTGGGAG